MAELHRQDYWDGAPDPVQGNTIFGYFDADAQFQTSAPKIAKFIASRLGFPVNDLEITDKQIYADIEAAMIQYSEIINDYKSKENYFNLIGSPRGENISDKLIRDNLKHIIRLSDQYALESHGADSGVTVHTGSIDIQQDVQNYDLKDLYFSVEHPTVYEYTIRRIFHNRTPASSAGYGMGTQMGSPIGGMPAFGAGAFDSFYGNWYTMMPMSYQLQRTQAIDMAREMNLSAYGFELRNNMLKLFPRPNKDFNLWFEYTLGTEEVSGADGSVYDQENLINDPSKLNFKLFQWTDINEQGRNWVMNYALALVKMTLGGIRRKYSTIPVPNSDISLDGDTLVNDGISEAETLKQDLREYLQELSAERALEIKRNVNESRREILNNVPLGLYKI